MLRISAGSNEATAVSVEVSFYDYMVFFKRAVKAYFLANQTPISDRNAVEKIPLADLAGYMGMPFPQMAKDVMDLKKQAIDLYEKQSILQSLSHTVHSLRFHYYAFISLTKYSKGPECKNIVWDWLELENVKTKSFFKISFMKVKTTKEREGKG